MSRKERSENTLLNAVQFISRVQPLRSKITTDIYCRLYGKQLSASGPVLSACVGIEDEIECCPDTHKFLEALEQCPEAINLTTMPTGELSIKSGNFKATIPCVEPNELPTAFADLKRYPVSIEFQAILEKLGSIVTEKAKYILYSSVQLLDSSIIATNGDIILEGWHGCATPVGAIVPKLFIKALHRTKDKSLYCLGSSPETLTAHYPDGSWIKTRLHHDPDYPNLQGFLSLPATFQPTPLGFWSAVERLASFSKDDRMYLTKDGICTDRYDEDGAINYCEGLPHGISYSISSLRLIDKLADNIAFNVTTNMTYFQGKNIRGAISQKSIEGELTELTNKKSIQ